MLKVFSTDNKETGASSEGGSPSRELEVSPKEIAENVQSESRQGQTEASESDKPEKVEP
jgi:hypothetical protein